MEHKTLAFSLNALKEQVTLLDQKMAHPKNRLPKVINSFYHFQIEHKANKLHNKLKSVSSTSHCKNNSLLHCIN